MDYSRIDPETVAWAYERASALLEGDLGSVGEPIFATCFVTTASLLAATILWVLALVYRPSRQVSVRATDTLRHTAQPLALEGARWSLQLRAIRADALSAAWAQTQLDRLVRQLRIAATLFATSLVFLLLTIGTLGTGAS